MAACHSVRSQCIINVGVDLNHNRNDMGPAYGRTICDVIIVFVDFESLDVYNRSKNSDSLPHPH